MCVGHQGLGAGQTDQGSAFGSGLGSGKGTSGGYGSSGLESGTGAGSGTGLPCHSLKAVLAILSLAACCYCARHELRVFFQSWHCACHNLHGWFHSGDCACHEPHVFFQSRPHALQSQPMLPQHLPAFKLVLCWMSSHLSPHLLALTLLSVACLQCCHQLYAVC